MKLEDLLSQLFPDGCKTVTADWLVTGEATVSGKPVSILGTTNHTFIGVREAVVLSEEFLDIAERFPGRPLLMLVDNNGQRMGLNEELLALPEYIAPLLKAEQVTRLAGCKLIAIVYGNTIAGGFIGFGMGADRVVSVPGGETSVMKLEAISRVTKMPLEKLQALAANIPVFAPGSKNFYKMGGLYEMWTDHFPDRLQRLLNDDDSRDLRAQIGRERGGRTAAQSIIDDVLRA
ncbi:MAG: biotin-independent malonate decarboxylase subunit gamma [Verrucomicrobiota bacterium]